MIKSLSKTLATVFLLSISFGCQREYFDTERFAEGEYLGEFAVPIIDASLSLTDLLKGDSNLVPYVADTGSGGLITLSYSDSAKSLIATNFYWMPTRSDDWQWSFNSTAISNFQSSGELSANYTIKFDYNPVAVLEYAVFNDGHMIFRVNNDFKHAGQMTVRFPEITKDGDTLTAIIPFDGRAGQAPTYDTIAIPLDGYRIEYHPSRRITGIVDIEMVHSGESTQPGDRIKLETEMNNPKYYLVNGEFNRRGGQLSLKLPLGFMKSFAGDAYFTDPFIGINFYNSLGLPMGFKVNELYTVADVNPDEQRHIKGPFHDEFKDVAPAPFPEGVTASTLFYANSNTEFVGVIPVGADPEKPMSYVVSDAPDTLYANFYAVCNPNYEPYIGFIVNSSAVDIVTDVYLPLKGRAQLTLQDTLSYDFASPDEARNLESMVLRLATENGFPLQAAINLQVMKMENGQYAPLFALQPNEGPLLIESALIKPAGAVQESKSQAMDITLTKEEVQQFAQGNRIVVTTTLSSEDYAAGRNILIESTNRLDIKLGVKAKTKISF